MRPGGELPLSNAGQLELLRAFCERGASLRTAVSGGSMSPCIREGDVVTVAPLRDAAPRVGDVVAAAVGDPPRLVIHRVVARRRQGWALRGDACASGDGVIAPRELLGRVVRVERAGRVVAFAVGAGGAAVALASRAGVPTAARRARASLRRVARP